MVADRADVGGVGAGGDDDISTSLSLTGGAGGTGRFGGSIFMSCGRLTELGINQGETLNNRVQVGRFRNKK